MQLGSGVDHSPPSSAAVMEDQSYTSTHPLGHTGPVTVSLYLYLYLMVNSANVVQSEFYQMEFCIQERRQNFYDKL